MSGIAVLGFGPSARMAPLIDADDDVTPWRA